MNLISRSLLAVALGAALLSTAVAAAPASPAEDYAQECGACHTPYSARLLPAASWSRVMSSLDKHFGVDASLEDAAVVKLKTWLTANAGTGRRAAEPPEDRITRSAWFVRQHDEVRASVWKHASVKSPANCQACHPGADKGQFDERAIRMPAGVGQRG